MQPLRVVLRAQRIIHNRAPGDLQLQGGAGFATYVDTGHFDLGSVMPGEPIDQGTVGAKLKLHGDGVFDQDRWWLQLPRRVRYKRNRDFDFVQALLGLGADDPDVDAVYLSAQSSF